MKNIFKTAFLLALAAVGFTGCKKDEVRDFFLGGTNPVLTANKTNIVLTAATEKEEAVEFNWSNPNYSFSTGLSSHDVQYALEIDINSQFNSAKKYVTTIAKDLSKSFSVYDFNIILGNEMELPLEQDVTVYARVVSSLRYEGAVNGELASNVVVLRTRPYAPPPTVTLPANGVLVLVGSGSPGGWDNNANNPQVFTKVSNTLYELTIQLIGGGSVLFLPVPGSWDYKYGYDGANNSNNVNGDKLKYGGGDIKVPATTGNYKISVDFQLGRFTITPQ